MSGVRIQERNSNKSKGRRTMKATELRIGNWVKMKKSDPIENYQISAILKKGVNSGSVGMLYEIIEPIPLTEEWLERFGFEPVFLENTDGEVLQDYHELNIDGFSKIVIESDFSFGIEDCRDTDCSVIFKNDILDSVHRLQNLYFALTGKELQTDETKKKVKE